MTPELVGWAAREHEALRRARSTNFVLKAPSHETRRARYRAFSAAMSRFHSLRYGEPQRSGGNVVWPIQEGQARFAYSVEFEEIGGRLECVSVKVETAPLRDEVEVTAEAFRVPIATIIAIARARLEPEKRERRRQVVMAEEARKAERWRTQYDMTRPPARIGWEEVAGSGRGGHREGSGRRKIDPAFLERVARIFSNARREGRPPAQAVRKAISAERGKQVSQDTVDGWIRKARREGILTLPPARSGLKVELTEPRDPASSPLD